MSAIVKEAKKSLHYNLLIYIMKLTFDIEFYALGDFYAVIVRKSDLNIVRWNFLPFPGFYF